MSSLSRGLLQLRLDGVPVNLEQPSEISGDVSIEIISDGPPFEARIVAYHGLPDAGEVIDCQATRGASEADLQGIPVQFSPASRVGELDIRLEVLDEDPPVSARLIDYPSLEEGEAVRAEVDDANLSIAHPDNGDYDIQLAEQAEKAVGVRVRLITVTPRKIEGKIEKYLSNGSTGQNLDRTSQKRSPFRSGPSKNNEIIGTKL